MATPNDTHPEADRVQIALLRAATPARSAALALRMSRWVAELSRRAIREANPALDDRETALRQLALDHGEDLARKVRLTLSQQQ